mgnify:CR=1 FL=1
MYIQSEDAKKRLNSLPKIHDAPFITGSNRFKASYEGYPKWMESPEKKIAMRRSAATEKKEGFK